MSATYRFVGEVPEVFPDLTGGHLVVAGTELDPNAEDFQQPGELRPGQQFEGPDDLVHARIERKGRGGKWSPTVEPAQQDEQGQSDPAPATGSATTEEA